MNILVISQYFYPENFRVNTLCTELVKRGHTVTVLTGYPQYPQGKIYNGYGFNIPYDTEWNGVKIIRVKVLPRGKTPIGLLLNCWSFVDAGNKWVKKCQTKYDVVYVFEVSPVTVGLPAVEYKKKFGTPMLFNVQDLWPENVEIVLGIHNKAVIGAINKIVDKIYASSDKILCSSRSFVKNIAERGVERNKLVYWPQFCVEPDLKNAERPSEYSDENFNVVFAGNIGDAQGLDLLIDVAIKLRGSGVKWYLIGDGRAKERLQKRASENELDDITFVGRVSETEADRYVHYADCAYLSFQDNALFDMTIPAKLQTYLACGTPILAVAGGESRSIVLDNGCGVSCGFDRDEVIACVLNLRSDSKAVEQMRKNARACYEENFMPKKIIGDLEKICEDVSDKSPVKHPVECM